ncbi:hypothetical protein [Hymenobacter nivis]|uniref:Ig-like domain-containing protein n=1 Tax=Hymenobacter nivis TaxID=1850093 RepID=A0A502GR15_9BACT|nr:hypothetical protein [Hymenobacter nivis]TPG63720.1 hypothetical protein EAH73_16870 [Hymenobacter nivis]
MLTAAISPQGCTARDLVDVPVVSLPVVRLGRDTVLCAEQPASQLSVGPQPAVTTYRWQDGSTAATFAALPSCRCRVKLRNAAGCTTRDSLLVRGQPCPVTIPNIITPNGQYYYWLINPAAGSKYQDWVKVLC